MSGHHPHRGIAHEGAGRNGNRGGGGSAVTAGNEGTAGTEEADGNRGASGSEGGVGGDVLVVGGVHRPGGAARGYAAGPPDPPRSGQGAGPGGGIRSPQSVTFSRRSGDGTATGQQASAQTVRPG